MNWPELFQYAQILSLFAAFAFVAIFMVGLIVIITPRLIDYIIRRMGGLKGLAGRLVWCLGASLAVSGAVFGLLMSILIALLRLFTERSVIGDSVWRLIHPRREWSGLAILGIATFCTP